MMESSGSEGTWSERVGASRVLRVVLALAVFAFTVYSVVDCAQTDEERVRNLPKLAWVVLILLFTPIGGIAWFLAGRPQPLLPPPGARGRTGREGPRGPDDDPDFLRSL